MRPPSNPPKRVEATLRQTAERGTTLLSLVTLSKEWIMLEVKHPSTWRGRGEALRARNRLPLSDFLRVIQATLCLSV